jgi:hypothetical protein
VIKLVDAVDRIFVELVAEIVVESPVANPEEERDED